MPANIRITSGVRSGATVWVEKPVLRIGSHPDVDLCIPCVDLEEHVATVEYREGRYVVHNRASGPLSMAGQDLAPGASRAWRHGETLRLGDESALELELTGDGAPSMKPVDIDYGDEEYEDTRPSESLDQAGSPAPMEQAEGKTSLKSIGQLSVILLCCLAIGGMLYSEFLQPQVSDSENATDIRAVLEGLDKEELLSQQLRDAEFARLRGEKEEARRLYESLRAQLNQRSDLKGAPRDELLKYLGYRLSTI